MCRGDCTNLEDPEAATVQLFTMHTVSAGVNVGEDGIADEFGLEYRQLSGSFRN